MADNEERVALKGLEKKLFKLMSKGATKAQWAAWLRAPLEHALAEGDTSLALTLLAAGADGGAGWEGCHGRTLLGAAAEGGNDELVSAVLEAGGSEELDTVYGDQDMTALHHSIASGHIDVARMLMVAGADVGLLDNRGRSALHYAVEGGHLQLAENAIIGGADTTAKDTEGNTPLHLAAAHAEEAFAATLLRGGASVSATNMKGQHPLHVAVKHDRVAVAEALLKAGADPNTFHDDHNRSPPLYSARLAMARTLLEYGAEVNLANSAGLTALHQAGGAGEADVIAALVEAGADVTEQSGWFTHRVWGEFRELTPMHTAAISRSTQGMSALLREGADVNAIDGDGRTPLHLVCKLSEIKADRWNIASAAGAASLLLRWGADETVTDKNGRTPKQLVKRARGTKPLQEVLANAPADRAWRRRGMLVMCRAFPDKISTKGGRGRAGKARARRGRGRGGGSAGGGQGRDTVLARVVGLEDDEVFRAIVGFL